jgi:hypothetical protein
MGNFRTLKLYKKAFENTMLVYEMSKTFPKEEADGENTEAIVWLDFALACQYISEEKFEDMINRFEETGKLINYYIDHPEKFV